MDDFTPPSEHFEEQGRIRGRACLYFTLSELLRNQTLVEATWPNIRRITEEATADPNTVASALLELGFTRSALANTYSRITAGLSLLDKHDRVLERNFPGYPMRAAQLIDAPEFLFVRQAKNILELPSISIVGKRHCSEAGRSQAYELAHLLSTLHVVVTSGLAPGINLAAQEGALDIRAPSVAVLGMPLTHNPGRHAELQRRIGSLGAVVSAFHPAYTITGESAALRSVTICALSAAVVVVEASDGDEGVALAARALRQGRDVFIPRTVIENGTLRWPRALEAKGARVFDSSDDLAVLCANVLA